MYKHMTVKKARRIAETGMWKNADLVHLARVQIHTRTLFCDWSVFQHAVEVWLQRPVWTHDFAHPADLIREAERKGV